MSEQGGGDSPDQTQQQAVRSAQERTLGLYHQLMQINAASHLIRSLRKLGLVDALREQQCTLEQLCAPKSLDAEIVREILDAAVAIGIVEQYQEDYALSRAAHLLCQYDHDLADSRWERLVGLAQGELSRESHDVRSHQDQLAATQWIHTPAAMEAAEVLDFGGDSSGQKLEILDLGCGSAVWSSAMAYRDPNAHITAVDHEAALEAAVSTAKSIGLEDRFQAVSADPAEVELEHDQYDWVVIAQRLSGIGIEEAESFLARAVKFLKVGGRLAVIDLFDMGGKVTLVDRLESLRLKLETSRGSIISPPQLQSQLASCGLVNCQFALLSKDRAKFGVVVGKKEA